VWLNGSSATIRRNLQDTFAKFTGKKGRKRDPSTTPRARRTAAGKRNRAELRSG
jgi:hypothetical protein